MDKYQDEKGCVEANTVSYQLSALESQLYRIGAYVEGLEGKLNSPSSLLSGGGEVSKTPDNLVDRTEAAGKLAHALANRLDVVAARL